MGVGYYYQSMKYTLEKLNELKSIRLNAKERHISYDGSSILERAFLKKIRREARREHREYRKKYKKEKKINGQIKRLEKEVSEHVDSIKAEKAKIKNSLDNIIVETNHDNNEEFFSAAIISYSLVQPVRFESVIPYIAQYEHSSKMHKIHKACKRVVSSKLDELNIKIQGI